MSEEKSKNKTMIITKNRIKAFQQPKIYVDADLWLISHFPVSMLTGVSDRRLL